MGFVFVVLCILLASGVLLLFFLSRIPERRQITEWKEAAPHAAPPMPWGGDRPGKRAPEPIVLRRGASADRAEKAVLTIRPVGKKTVRLIVPRAERQAVTIMPKAALVITPPRRAIWEDYGWTVQTENGTNEYVGEYQVTDERTGETRVFAGRMRETGIKIDVYVFDPPPELYPGAVDPNRHPENHCFYAVDPTQPPPAWFTFHWKIPAEDPDSALLYIERVLSEAINHSWEGNRFPV